MSEAPFPFGFPAPTALYVGLYVLTLVLHVAFMNYVLAGSACLAVGGLARAAGWKRPESRTSALVRDWLPFALGATITAGVAPFLFIQILYPHRFYTANLLLHHRWMLVLPAMIAGFYLLYLLKSPAIAAARRTAQAAVGTAAFACFAFTAFSWTENYLLSTDAGAWPALYASRAMVYRSAEALPRILMWSVGAFPTFAVLVGWQLVWRGEDPPAGDWQRLALVGGAGLVLASGLAVLYGVTAAPAVRREVAGPGGVPYVVLAAAGGLAQAVAWLALARGAMRRGPWLKLASAGLAATLVGMTAARELARLGVVDVEALYPRHAQAIAAGGMWIFLLFAAVNAALIARVIRLVAAGAGSRPERGEATRAEARMHADGPAPRP